MDLQVVGCRGWMIPLQKPSRDINSKVIPPNHTEVLHVCSFFVFFCKILMEEIHLGCIKHCK